MRVVSIPSPRARLCLSILAAFKIASLFSLSSFACAMASASVCASVSVCDSRRACAGLRVCISVSVSVSAPVCVFCMSMLALRALCFLNLANKLSNTFFLKMFADCVTNTPTKPSSTRMRNTLMTTSLLESRMLPVLKMKPANCTHTQRGQRERERQRDRERENETHKTQHNKQHKRTHKQKTQQKTDTP